LHLIATGADIMRSPLFLCVLFTSLIVLNCGPQPNEEMNSLGIINDLPPEQWALSNCGIELELSPESPIRALRDFIKQYSLNIKTSGTERTKARIFEDIMAALANLCPCGDIPEDISMRELRAVIKTKGFPIKTAGRGRTKAGVRSDVLAACSELSEFQEIEVPTATDVQPLLSELTALTENIEFDHFGTEASCPYEVVRITTEVQKLDSFEDFRQAVLAMGPEKLGLQASDLDTYGKFEPTEKAYYSYLKESQAQVAEALIGIFSQELREAKVIIVGAEYEIPSAEHPIFIVGIGPDNTLIGLKAIVVWT
jgi:hypothetical protein